MVWAFSRLVSCIFYPHPPLWLRSPCTQNQKESTLKGAKTIFEKKGTISTNDSDRVYPRMVGPLLHQRRVDTCPIACRTVNFRTLEPWHIQCNRWEFLCTYERNRVVFLRCGWDLGMPIWARVTLVSIPVQKLSSDGEAKVEAWECSTRRLRTKWMMMIWKSNAWLVVKSMLALYRPYDPEKNKQVSAHMWAL